MIDATRIEQPEVERPDLYVRLYTDERSPIEDHAFGTSWALPTMPEDAGSDWFRLPGTRREKLTKALMEALADRNWSRIMDAHAALLDLDAEGVKG